MQFLPLYLQISYEVQSKYVNSKSSPSILRLAASSLAVQMSSKTGFVYDANMALHKNVTNPRHPESPARVTEAYDLLKGSGLLETCIRVKSRYWLTFLTS